MAKASMAPVRREQICRAAARVIAERGLDRTTLREVAEVAGVSTGTINHYFDNKLDMLLQTLVYVSERFQAHQRERVDAVPHGSGQLREFVCASLDDTPEMLREGWKVWLAAWSEASRSGDVQNVITQRRLQYHALIGHVLRGMEGGLEASSDEIDEIANEIDAFVNGIGLHIMTGETHVRLEGVIESIVFLAEGRLREAARGTALTGGRGPHQPSSTRSAVGPPSHRLTNAGR